MDDFSSPRIERLAPDSDRNSEPPPRNPRKKSNSTPPVVPPLTTVEAGDQRDFDREDQELDAAAVLFEKHQLDERG